jgi:hypothetical protein
MKRGFMEFTEFPKIARLSRRTVISEKIDGTNSCISISEENEFLVGSRTRWITPEDDNYGFAKWAYEHKDELMQLGPGKHVGEWWGLGIQRTYGLKEKRFSLFNTIRWCLPGQAPGRIETLDPRIEKYQEVLPACCSLVPVLYDGVFSTVAADECLGRLKLEGSAAAPGFLRPEGVVVGNVGFKKTIEKDEEHKGQRK